MLLEYEKIEFPVLKIKKINYLNSQFENLSQYLKSSYKESEISSWPKQEAEARNYLLNNEFKTPLIDSICETRQIDKLELVNKIIKNSDNYSQRIGELIGRLKNALKKVEEASTLEELNQIVF